MLFIKNISSVTTMLYSHFYDFEAYMKRSYITMNVFYENLCFPLLSKRNTASFF